MNTKTNKMKLSMFIPGEIPDASFTGSTLPRKQGAESHLHPLGTVKVIFKLKLLFLESILTVDNVNNSIQP